MMMNRGTHQQYDDKLSDLPDCVLVHILSFLNIQDAVRTNLLSTRWKHLWKRLQTLSFNGIPFRNYTHFTEFTNQVLSLHDPSTALIALDLQTMFPVGVEPHLLKTIETFVASRNQNLKRLSLFYCGDINRIPSPNFLFSCHSLESLKLKGLRYNEVFPDSLNLPALTYLKLSWFAFRGGDDGRAKPFSRFNNLNSLIIKDCKPEKDEQTLCISNAMLVDLVIDTRYKFSNIELSAPSLCTFTFDVCARQKLSWNSLSCVKHVSIRPKYLFLPFYKDHAAVISTWLIELVNLESLRISANTLQSLSEILDSDLLKSKHTSWSNLKSLQVILDSHKEYMDEQMLIMMRQRDVNHEVASGKPWKGNAKLREAIKALEPYASIPDGGIDFFIQNSPFANVDILIPKEPKGYYLL